MAYWYLIPVGMQMLSSMGQAEAQQKQAEAQARQLELEADAQSLAIDRELNDALENQAIVGAMQGRTGGTLQIIADESQRAAELDKSLIDLNATAQASALRAYGSASRNAGVLGALSSGAMSVYSAESGR